MPPSLIVRLPALRIFVSHSSRLRDGEVDDAQAQANGRLLQDLPAQMQRAYAGRVDVLLDHRELDPGDDWRRRLHLLLDDCDAGMTFCSPRALEESDDDVVR